MKSDVHHLRPSLSSANSARSNYPFAEISASNTYKWYKGKDRHHFSSTNCRTRPMVTS
eukprot:gnl/Chilomastix_caulleri/6588.p1 GENE.gnl/Chilomastix_caulleri/6588~~gnl/Chilomastix_caulleri/6588.p1  ORF type:complete len:58 (+),score=8.26 gnl/Chilomastix_caulleri/6588:38-211(+)